MKKTAALTAVLALALAATGCSAQQPAGIDREKIYLELVHENTTNTATDAELIRMAKASCSVLEDGGTIREIALVVAKSGHDAATREEVSTIIGYGISQYCPEYSNQR